MIEDAPALARPSSEKELFVAFTLLALQGFGGVLAVAQRVLCEQRRWLTREQFVEILAVAQVLPGPNVCNLALMIGDRFFGWRGAFAALAGMMAVPLVIVLLLTALYAEYSMNLAVSGGLRGMGAVSAGLIVGTGLKLNPLQNRGRGRERRRGGNIATNRNIPAPATTPSPSSAPAWRDRG